MPNSVTVFKLFRVYLPPDDGHHPPEQQDYTGPYSSCLSSRKQLGQRHPWQPDPARVRQEGSLPVGSLSHEVYYFNINSISDHDASM